MITPFTFDPEVVAIYRTAQTVRSVVQRMDGSKVQRDFTYHGKSKECGITEHRIREIIEIGDLGTTITNGPWYFNHHTTEAISELDSHLDKWDFMKKHLARVDVFKRVYGFIERARERIHPACYAIRDADTSGYALNSYQEIEGRWIAQSIRKQKFYQARKQLASQNIKYAVRQEEIAAAEEVLIGFKYDVTNWINSVKSQIE
jgi:hypothetical protein